MFSIRRTALGFSRNTHAVKPLNLSTQKSSNSSRLRFRLWGPSMMDNDEFLKALGPMNNNLIANPLMTSFFPKMIIRKIVPKLKKAPYGNHHMIQAFEEGRGTECYRVIDESIPVVMDRPELENDLSSLLSPSGDTKFSSCAVVLGDSGSGKSVMIRKVINSFLGPKGVVYCNAPINGSSFSLKLRRLLGYERKGAGSPKLTGSLFHDDNEPDEIWLSLKGPLLEAAKGYKSKYHRPMVLVIDSADILARERPKLLRSIRDFAETCADISALRVVLVSTDGSTLCQLQSEVSGHGHRSLELFEIGHLSDKMAQSLLMQRGIPVAAAGTAVKSITGGSFTAISDFLTMYNPKESINTLIEDLEKSIMSSLVISNVDLENDIFRLMVAKPAVSIHNMLRFLTKEQIQNLLNHKIIAFHPRGLFTFHSRKVALFIKERLSNIRDETAAFVNFLIACY